MKVLSIGTDKNIFKEGSAVRSRVAEYGSLFDEMHVVVFTLRDRGYAQQQIAPNVWIYPTHSLSRFLYVRDAKRLGLQIVATRTLDYKNTTITCEDPFGCGAVGVSIKKQTRIPLHIQVHTDVCNPFFKKESVFNRFKVHLARRVFSVADAIRVVSDRVKNDIERLHMARVVPHVLPIFVDIDKLQAGEVTVDLRQKYPQFNFIILMASRLTKEKNIDVAFEALKQITPKYPKVGVVVVGEGPQKRTLQHIVHRLGLDHNVVFEPWQHNLSSYYKTAHLFLVTSQYEGYGMTIIEALAAGCPTIATDVGIARDVLTDGDVFVCPVGDASCLAKKIIACIENNALRETFVNEAFVRLQKVTHPSKEVFLSKYKESIESAHHE